MAGDGLPKLLAQRIDYLAEHSPNRVYASIPKNGDDLSEGYVDISYLTFASAINQAAWWLDSHLSQFDHDGQKGTFTYDGPSDLRWLIYFVAAIKTGRKMVLTMTFSALERLQQLFEVTGCSIICYADNSRARSTVEKVLELGQIRNAIAVPELKEFVDEFGNPNSNIEANKHYPYDKTWKEVVDDPVVILTTSGTTGFPKPLPYTNRMIHYWSEFDRLYREDNRVQLAGRPGSRIHNTFYITHGGGFFWNLFLAVYSGTVCVLGDPYSPLDPQTAKQVLRYSGLDAVAYTTNTASALASDPEGLELLRKTVHTVSFGGASLDDLSVQRITENNGPEIRHCYGSIETEMFAVLRPEGHEWPYLCFHPDSGHRFRRLDEKTNLHEGVIERIPGHENLQPIFSLYPDLQEFHTKDLFSPHPRIEGMWECRGRIDDVVVLGTAQNFFVADMERALQQHPAVSAALIGGHGLRRPFALIELHSHEYSNFQGDQNVILEAIWPQVQIANAQSESKGHTDLLEETIIIGSPQRPFVRTGKSNVDRRGTFELYKKDIDSIPVLKMNPIN